MIAGFENNRTVVTGIGVVSPIGIGKDAFWKSLIAGQSGVDFLHAFPNHDLPFKLSAEIKDFDPRNYIADRKFIKVMSRDIQLGVAASQLAMKDAGLNKGDIAPERLGVEFGAGRISTGPNELLEAVRGCSNSEHDFDYHKFGSHSMEDIHPLWLLRQLPNAPACFVSIDHDARGPNNTITARDSSALLALAEAIRTIERGAADCMIVGASSSNVSPVDITKLSLYEGLSHRDHDPETASRPFDFERDGAIVGEGSAVFVLESYEHARKRGANIYCEVLGVGSGCDGAGDENSMRGTGLVRATQSALQQANINPAHLSHINAHGKSTQRDDLVEARALHEALGTVADSLPVTALKSYFGYFDAGSGAVELAGTLLALQHGELPLTLNYETPDPRCQLQVVHDQPMPLRSSAALTVNRTSMGQSAAAVVRAI